VVHALIPYTFRSTLYVPQPAIGRENVQVKKHGFLLDDFTVKGRRQPYAQF
jgi:hypothetical protein